MRQPDVTGRPPQFKFRLRPAVEPGSPVFPTTSHDASAPIDVTTTCLFRRRALAGALVLAAFAAAAGVARAPALTTTASPASTTTTIAAPRYANARAVQLAITVARQSAQLATLKNSLADVQARLLAAATALQETEDRLAAAQATLHDIIERLRGRAVVAYVRHSNTTGAIFEISDLSKFASAQQYTNALAVVDSDAADKLRAEVDALTEERAKRIATRDDLAHQSTDLSVQVADLEQQTIRQRAELTRLGGVPIMGQTELSAEELASWFRARGSKARLAGDMTIEELATIYVDEGNSEGVRADIAFAQSIIETGSFGHALDNNYGGIGACDSCNGEITFPTPRDGVRAQIQMLRAFADPSSSSSKLAHPPSPQVFGSDPVAAQRSYDTVFYRGSAPLWNLMGNGNWATAPAYCAAVLGIYADMLAFSSRQPG